MRLVYTLTLAVLLAGCASSSSIQRNAPGAPRLPLPAAAAPRASVEPGATWYIVPAGVTLPGYGAPMRTIQHDLIPAETRYQVMDTSGPFLSIATSKGQRYWISPAAAPTPYTPTEADAARHARLDREYLTCATTADPQAALAAGRTELDADSDGLACEDGHRATAAPAPSAPAYTPSSGSGGGPVRVRGYTRRDGTYVAPHTRSRPRRR